MIGSVPSRGRATDDSILIRDEMESMLAARERLNDLLQRLATSFHPSIPNQNSIDSIELTRASLQVLADMLQSAQDRADFCKLLAHRQYLPALSHQSAGHYNSSSTSIPALCLPQADAYTQLVGLPTLVEIASDLAAGRKKILVNGFRGPLALSEAVDEEYLVDDPDGLLYDEDMKSNDRDTWLEKLGDYRLKCLLRRISLVIADADLSLSQRDIDAYSTSAVRRAAAINVDKCSEKAQTAVELLFGFKESKRDGGNIIVKACKSRLASTRCHVGLGLWEKGRYGMGIAVEMETSFELHWKPKPQAPSCSEVIDAELNSKTCVGHVLVKTTQRHSLGLENDSDVFVDEAGSFDKQLEIDPKQVQISARILASDGDEGLVITKATGKAGVPLSQVVYNNNSNSDTESLQDTSKDSMDGLLNTELYVCGGSSLLGQDNQKSGPIKVPFVPLTLLERIKSVVCSDTHALCLTSLGIVYSYGDGSDGQLGHGNVGSSHIFRPIEWFLTKGQNAALGQHVTIVQISVGSDRLSSHSAAIDSEGALYTWGKATVCGHIGFDSGSAPAAVPTVTLPKRVETLQNYRILQVSCGGSFTLARATPLDDTAQGNDDLLRTIRVFSWGLLSSGRCGTGPRKLEVDDSYLHAGTRKKKAPIYQLRPCRISSLDDKKICDISAGKSHGLAVSSSGHLYVWGRSSDGQCGITGTGGEGRSSVWDDAFFPVRVEPFGCTSSGPMARSASAGLLTSAVIDTTGRLWTWGGGGGRNGILLGHGELCDGIFAYADGTRDTLPSSGRAMTTTAMLSGCFKTPSWCIPRTVDALEGSIVTNVSISDSFGAAVTRAGEVYVWGDETKSSSRTTANSAFDTGAVATPTQPWPRWRQSLSTKTINDFAASSGMGALFVTEGQVVCNALGSVLLRECSGNDLNDCCIVVSTGQRLHCHKVVLACRSTSLKMMLKNEERPPGERNAIIELLFPDIQYEVAQGLLQYIYTDSVRGIHVSTPSLTLGLMEAANNLGLGNLVEICRRRLLDVDLGSQQGEIGSAGSLNSTFAADCRSMLDEKAWADVQITSAGGEVVYAHWCLLAARSSYFGKIYESLSKRKDDFDGDDTTCTCLELSESHESINRLLLFIYTGELVSLESQDNDELLVEDLMSAYKYDVGDMKRLIESAIIVTDDNAVEMYKLALSTKSKRLEQEALRVMSSHLKPGNIDLNPQSISAVFRRVKDRSIYSTIPRARLESALTSVKMARHRRLERRRKEEQDMMGGGDDEGLPISILIALVLSVLGYVILQNAVVAGPAVFVINAAFVAVTLRYVILRLK